MKRLFLSCLVFVFLISNAYAATSGLTSGVTVGTNYNTYNQGFTSYYSASDIQTYWPILADRDNCLARQDVLLQVAPAGCQPTVVRSDILAEQNVPVFCQIDALTLNPLIDIKEIKGIRFSGNYPKEVVGTGFHPAQAALRTRDTLLGSPLINNVGYAVVILRRNQNESSLPEYVNLTLNGIIDYDIQNALGVGTAEFVLEPTSDSEWNDASVRNKNSFWQGRYFLRLEGVDENYAQVSIYSGSALLTSVKVKRGETSREIYLPGFYCKAALQVNYDGFVEQETKATIEIGDSDSTDVVQLYKGSRFLNNKCSVVDIIPNKIRSDAGNVTVNCNGQRIDLQLRLPGNGLFDVFRTKDNKTVTPAAMTYPDGKSYTTVYLGGEYYALDDGNGLYKVVEDMPQLVSKVDVVENGINLTKLKQALIEYKSVVAEKGADVANNLIDEQYGSDSEKVFNDAILNYENVAKDYPAEKTGSAETSEYFGEKALSYAIDLSRAYNKYQTLARLAEEYIKLYPKGVKVASYKDELNKYNTIDPSKSANVVYIDNKYRTMRLISLEEPAKKASADFSWGAKSLSVNKGESMEITNVGNVTLDSLIGAESVRATARCIEEVKSTDSKGKATTTKKVNVKSWTFKVGQIENVCGQSLKLDRVNLERVAKIRLTPSVKGPRTETNLTVVIGIEKRAIQLTPEETKDRINELNESINNFERISESLGEVVKGLKATCFATAAILTVKNFVTGMDGTGSARQQVMRGVGGWNEKCTSMVSKGEFQTITQCYNANAAEIENTVKTKAKAMTEVNGVLKGYEQAHTKSDGGLFGGGYVEREKVVADYRNYLNDKYGTEKITDPTTGKTVSVSELLKNKNGYENGEYGYEQLRDLHTDLLMQSSSNSVAKDLSKNDAWTIASQIQDNQNLLVTNLNTENWAKKGLPVAAQVSTKNQQSINAQVVPVTDDLHEKYFPQDTEKKVKYMSIVNAPPTSTASTGSLNKETKDFNSAASYAVGLQKSSAGSNYGVIAVTKLKDQGGEAIRDESTVSGNGVINAGEFSSTYQMSSVNAASDITCMNKYKNAKIKYYDNEPYKGMPALVPFDLNRGWYVATKPVTAGFGNIATYQSSGLVNSFYVCNVGKNGREQFLEGARDDICQLVNTGTGQSLSQFSCLSDAEGKKLINDATIALQQAAEQKGNSLATINVGGRGSISLKPEATTTAPSTQCQDSMSVNDCKILFNVCDPVICPASRCNLGGQYQVSDVIQSGVIGSLVLCLPNFKEGVMLPVCLTGVKAGLDAYVSLLKGHRDCLQESLNTSQMVGVCDEIYSIYTCEFFWSQFAPVASTLLPKLLEFGSGTGGARGGGEYQNVAGAWNNAEKSVNYFTQTYAVNSMNAFQVRNIQDAGSMFCKAYISGVGPSTFDSLIEPDSPSQFYARFDTYKFSDATVPATSQYKVYYHIFAGNDQGVYYSVYLKNPPETSYYYSASQVMVATGFISKGQYKSETRDFTAPQGYKQLCVRINDKEDCGFQEVSTNFAVNYLSDTFAAQEINKSGITSQKDCISGGASIGGLISSPNLQAGVNSVVDPAVYNQGVVRVCATLNPGRSTEPTRYVDVGYCDDSSMRCWLDKRSVTNAIGSENIGITNATLQSISSNQISALQASGDLFRDDVANEKLKAWEAKKNELKLQYVENDALLLISTIDGSIQKFYRNDMKAWAYLIRAELKGTIALDKKNKLANSQKTTASGTTTTTTEENVGVIALKSIVDGKQTIVFNGDDTSFYFKGGVVYFSDSDAVVGSLKNGYLYIDSEKITNEGASEQASVFGNSYNKIIVAPGVKISPTIIAASSATTMGTTGTTTGTAKSEWTIIDSGPSGGLDIYYNGKSTNINVGYYEADTNVYYNGKNIGRLDNGFYVIDDSSLTEEEKSALKSILGETLYSDIFDNGFTLSSSSDGFKLVVRILT